VSNAPIDVQDIENFFTRSDGQYLFARWGRPIVPVVFGVQDETLTVVKGAVEAIVALANHKMAETDPELGANLMFFFFSDWAELPQVPQLDKLVPELTALCTRLQQADANQYRIFRFDAEGAIKAAFVFIRIDADLAAVPAEVLALSQAVQVILLWSDRGFDRFNPLVEAGNGTVLRTEFGAVIRAAYQPILPVSARDKSHALRVYARMIAPS
jgi:hypothetical protein